MAGRLSAPTIVTAEIAERFKQERRSRLVAYFAVEGIFGRCRVTGGLGWKEDIRLSKMDGATSEWSKINVALNFTGPIFWRVVRTASKDRNEAAISEAIGSLGKKLDIAEVQLARHAFLSGDEFTLADIQFGHVLYRYFDIAIDCPELPALRRYYERLTARPAFRKQVMVSYEERRVL
jgi:glutathione S-transferase